MKEIFRRTMIILVLGVLILSCNVGYAENIDPCDDDSQYAYGENFGWLNFEPMFGPGVTVTKTEVIGFVWAENIGWINLSPTNYGEVTNDGSGNLSGYAWGENVGWISFSCENTGSCATVDYGVTIDEDGNFDGWAWGENIGWIHFQNLVIPYKVQTAWVPSEPDIDVTPLALNFGSVAVGTSFTLITTISNTGEGDCIVTSLTLSGTDFFLNQLTPTPPFNVPPATWIEVWMDYTPGEVGDDSGELQIASNDPDEPIVTVSLSGTGIEAPSPPVTVEAILTFYDESVSDGKLSGTGPGNSAEGRLKALRNMIEAAGDLIDDGNLVEGCQQLMDAYNRCDGLPKPPEFVEGDAADDLAKMILELVESLAC